MTPTAAELLNGCVAAIAAPPQAEDLALYFKGKLSLVAILNILCAQEAERRGGDAGRRKRCDPRRPAATRRRPSDDLTVRSRSTPSTPPCAAA